MYIEIDKAVCTGHARCNEIAPDLVDLDDEGFDIQPTGPVPADRVDAAFAVRLDCPEGAIRLSENEDGE